MQLFHTHIQSLPILRTFHIETSRGVDTPNKSVDIPKVSTNDINEVRNHAQAARNIAGQPDPAKDTAAQDQKTQLNAMWPGGTEYTEPTESMNTQIARGQSEILQSDKQVQAAMSSPSGDTIMSNAQKVFNANKDWQDAINGLKTATPKEKAQFFEQNPELANFLMKFGNDTIKAENMQDPSLKKISEQIDQTIAFNTKK